MRPPEVQFAEIRKLKCLDAAYAAGASRLLLRRMLLSMVSGLSWQRR